MLDLDAVPWETRKCCAKDMRKAAQVIAITHMLFFGPVLFGMLYILNNQRNTLFFGDNITGPLPSELQLVLISSLVVLGLRLVFSFVLFVAEKSVKLASWPIMSAMQDNFHGVTTGVMLDLDAVPWETRKCCAKDMRKAAQVIAITHMVTGVMLDLDAVPWETRKCCAKDMRKAAQVIAITHMLFFGPVLFGMLYILNNQRNTLFFGDNITGPLPSELQLVLISSLVVLGLRLVFSFVLFVAEKSRGVALLRVWLAAHFLLSLAECGLVTALSTVVFVVDPELWPFVGTLLGGFLLLGLQMYMLHVVVCLHTGLMKERVLRRQVAHMHSQLNQLAVRTGYRHPLAYAMLSLSPRVPRPPGKVAPGLHSGVTTPPAGGTVQSPPGSPTAALPV